MPLGCMPDEKYENIEFGLQTKDRLIFYTDGIIEIKNSDEKMFGEQNLHKLVKTIGECDLESFADKIIETLKKWYNTSETVFADDVTLLALEIKDFKTNGIFADY
jgi:sigma-B regulation protein RsbU (phosphoserine phosphatase)